MKKCLLFLVAAILLLTGCGDSSSSTGGLNSDLYVGNAQSSVYYFADCEVVRDIPYDYRVWSSSTDFLEGLGFRPDEVCGPNTGYQAITSGPTGATVSAFVDYVVDGDTINVSYIDGSEERVRLIGVNTPEVGECFFNEASLFTTAVSSGLSVILEFEDQDPEYDIYGRLLAYVYLPGGAELNREIILNGYGYAYTFFPFKKEADYIDAELQAQANELGLWSACY